MIVLAEELKWMEHVVSDGSKKVGKLYMGMESIASQKVCLKVISL